MPLCWNIALLLLDTVPLPKALHLQLVVGSAFFFFLPWLQADLFCQETTCCRPLLSKGLQLLGEKSLSQLLQYSTHSSAVVGPLLIPMAHGSKTSFGFPPLAISPLMVFVLAILSITFGGHTPFEKNLLFSPHSSLFVGIANP